MSLLLWNCRGLGNPRTENELVSLIQAKDPSVVFIAETWADETKLDRTLSKINFEKKWVVPRLNKGGGLVLFWKNNINIKVVDSHRYFMMRSSMGTPKMHGISLAFMESPKPIGGMKHGAN